MTVIAVWPLVVALLGLALWALASGKPSEAGRMLFQIGMLWLVYSLMGHVLKLGS